MRFKQIVETTTAGSVATVAQPMMTQTRENVNVPGLKPVQQLMKGKSKKKGPYANSINEGKVKQLTMDLKELTDEEFKKKYSKTKVEIKADMKKVNEDDLAEQDLIVIPGQGRLRRTGFVKQDLDQGEHEGHTLKNSLHTIARAASDLDKRLSTQSEFPEWVSEKIGAAKGMMVTVMDYLISSQEMQQEPDAMNEDMNNTDYTPQVGEEILWRSRNPMNKMMPVPGTVLAIAPGKVTIKIKSPRLIQNIGKDTIVLNLSNYVLMPKQGVAEASNTMQRYGQQILKRKAEQNAAAQAAGPQPKKEEPPASSDYDSMSTRDFMKQLRDQRRPKKKGVAEGSVDKKPYPKTWHDVDPKIGKLVDKMSPEEKVKKGYANPSILKKNKQQGAAEEITADDMAQSAHMQGLKHGREGSGNNMDRAKAQHGENFKHYNAGFLKGRNEKAKSLKAFGQGYNKKRPQPVAEGFNGEYDDEKEASFTEARTSVAVRLGRAIERTQGKTAASQARSIIPSSIPKKEEPKKDEKKVDEGIQAGDGFIIECGDSAIETVVLGHYNDGILIEFDHTATFMLTDAGITLTEAEYQGRTVPLGKRMAGDVKKSKVYVKKPNGNVVKVNFGDKNMTIKKHLPKHRKSYRARHHCENPGPKWKANYWSCRAW